MKKYRQKFDSLKYKVKLDVCRARSLFNVKSIKKQYMNSKELLKELGRFSLENGVEFENDDNNLVFLVSHSFDRTGSPTALLYLADYLKKIGYRPIMISEFSGNMIEEMEKGSIEYLVLPVAVLGQYRKTIEQCISLIVCCTIYTANVIEYFNGSDIPTIWWLHDAPKYYTKQYVERLPRKLNNNVKVYTGGEIAETAIKTYRDYVTEEFLFAIPAQNVSIEGKKSKLYGRFEGKTVFAVLGNKCERKGQDLLLRALSLLDKEIIEKCAFVFIGQAPKIEKKFYSEYSSLLLNHQGTAFDYDQMSLEELYLFIDQVMDCLICPSREEPMSIVATNALQFGKLVICSDKTGISKYIIDGKCGIVHKSEDIDDISRAITDAIKMDTESRNKMKKNAIQTYSLFFSYEAFEKNVQEKIVSLIVRRM